MAHLIARFTVSGWAEHDTTGIGEGWVSAVRMSKTFTAGILGESTALFVSSGDVDGERSYMAAERITGRTEDGLVGGITVHHGGLESSPDTWFGHIVPRSGAGDFGDWTGSARIEHDAEGAFFVLDLPDLSG